MEPIQEQYSESDAEYNEVWNGYTQGLLTKREVNIILRMNGSVSRRVHSVYLSDEYAFIESRYETMITVMNTTYRVSKGVTSKIVVRIKKKEAATWSLPKVLTVLLPAIKEEILARDGFIVIRPDSFWTNPQDCLCGYDYRHPKMVDMNMEEVLSIRLGVVEYLWNLFGGTVNSKGFKVLNPKIGTIYGDGLNFERVVEICERLIEKGFASSNWVGGIGSFFFQLTTRDQFGFAQKCTYVEFLIDGKIEGVDVFKDPITDDGTKKSAVGLLAVYEKDDTFVLINRATWDQVHNCAFTKVFEDGVEYNTQSLKQIRERVSSYERKSVPV